jgi:hypothetical protein
MTNFWATMLALTSEFFCLKNLAKYRLDQEPEPKLF